MTETKAPPKVVQPHPWQGRLAFYWRIENQATGEISPLPAMLIRPTRLTPNAWDINFWRVGAMQGRTGIKFSDEPKAGCFTFADEEEEQPIRRGPGRPRKNRSEEPSTEQP